MNKLKPVVSRVGLVAFAVFAVSCTESAGPERGRSVPSFSYSPNGVSLSRSVGTLAQSGSLLIKGFNPANPHHGDAIVATFFWLGSTMIIDSVVDVVTTNPYTRVGNTYRLVEYIQAGGYSMATYVATNVQGFADPNTDPGQVLAVAAYLSQSVSDGGVTLAAFTGVDDNFIAALGAHNSKSGSGSQPMFAHADPIAVNAGAVAYTITMAGLWGLDPPAGFSRIGPGSDNVMKNDAAYAVQPSTGTIDPQWGWFFGSSDTWLVTTLALNAATNGTPPPPPPPPPPPATGDLTATTSTSGSSLDPDGYSVAVDGGASRAIAVNGSVTFTGLAAGDHSVALGGVASNCTVSGTNTQTVSVPAGGTVTATFAVSCVTPPGNLAVSTSSSGASIPSSYTVTVDGSQNQTIASTGSVTFTNLAAGNHTAVLAVPGNCTVSGGASRSVSVPSGGTVNLSYAVSCNAPPVVNAGPDATALTGLLYTLQWSFSDANHNGPWTYTINWGDGSTSSGTVASEGSVSNGHTYITVLPRDFTVTVTVRDASGAATSDTKVIRVLLL